MSAKYEYVRARFSYDPDTGILSWSNGQKTGKQVGCIDKEGYRVTELWGRQQRVHRLIWLFVHGVWPEHEVDHINGVRDDNRISNLRNATRTQNGRNYRKPRTNKSGYKGVSWNMNAKKWATAIRVDGGKKVWLGAYDCPELAALVYGEHAAAFHGEFFRAA